MPDHFPVHDALEHAFLTALSSALALIPQRISVGTPSLLEGGKALAAAYLDSSKELQRQKFEQQAEGL